MQRDEPGRTTARLRTIARRAGAAKKKKKIVQTKMQARLEIKGNVSDRPIEILVARELR